MRIRSLLIKIIFFISFFANTCFSQNNDTLENKTNPEPFEIYNPAPPSNEINNTVLPLTGREFWLSIIVLFFGVIIIIVEIVLIQNKRILIEDALKIIVITLIIISTLFLITAGYSNNQIAPAMGLLGTISGYLLGKSNIISKKDQNE